MMKKGLLILGGVTALGVALFAVAGARAQEGEDEGPVRDFVGRLAEKLGISEDELTTAVKEVELEMIDEALADGRITEEQAAEMRERVASGELRFPGRGHPGARCFLAGRIVDVSAEVLGIERSEVIDGLQDGQSLAQIAEGHGISVDEFKAELTGTVESNLAEKVEEGYVTQERADRMLGRFTNNLDRVINHVPDGDVPGRCPGPRPDGGGDEIEGTSL
jgi:hypothetical protein